MTESNDIENKLVETGEKEVEELDSPLVIINKILAKKNEVPYQKLVINQDPKTY